MRNMILGITAAALAVPATFAVPAATATAASLSPASAMLAASAYDPQRRYRYREFRGRDGRYYCKKPDGTTGAIVGGVAGALLGRTVDTRGDRTVGTLGGAVAGGLLGREVERSSGKKRCR